MPQDSLPLQNSILQQAMCTVGGFKILALTKDIHYKKNYSSL